MKKGAIAVIAVIAVVLVIIGAATYESATSPRHRPAQVERPPERNGHNAEQHKPPATAARDKRSTTPSPSESSEKNPAGRTAQRPEPAGSPAERYCARGHDKSDSRAITQAGGLVQIFRHESALSDAYGCAAAYLNHGGDVNAVDARKDSKHLTPLLFAIKRNDPKMVHFMLDHGADPNKRGGPNHIRPYGYAVFQALHNQSTNYNTVINILDSALGGSSADAQ